MGLYSRRAVRGEVGEVGEDLLVCDQCDAWVVQVEPVRDLAVGDNEDLTYPGSVLLQRT